MLIYDDLKNEHKILPFFPLKVFLLPGEDLPLRIFEPRYLQLIEEAEDENFTFVIPYLRDDEVMDYGCEVKLQEVVAESKTGQKVITVESVSLVRILSYTTQMTGKLYGGGTVELLSPLPPLENKALIAMVRDYMKNFDKDFLKSTEGKEMCYEDILRSLNLSSEDKYRFIASGCSKFWEKFLASNIQYMIMIRSQEKKLNNDFQLN
jgi:Lon protease-like protein